MTIDIHCHVVGNGKDIDNADKDVYVYAEDNQHWFTRTLWNMMEADLIRTEGDLNRDKMISTNEYIEHIYRMLTTSSHIDGMVLLAMDAVYSQKTGQLDKERTDVWVTNRFLIEAVRKLNLRLAEEGKHGKRFYMGASVSPNRTDWQTELQFVLDQPETVLLKLIPSTQHISLRDTRHKDYFEMLAEAGLPLLCHVGPEYSFPEGIRRKELDNFRFLEYPLSYGVTVIAAHCASPVFPLVDKNEMREFTAFMREMNSDGIVRVWADTSALSLATRLPFIQEIVESYPAEWLVHGSDFPIPIDGWVHLPLVTHDVSIAEFIRIRKAKNPLDRDVLIKRAHGFSDSILANAEKVLRLP